MPAKKAFIPGAEREENYPLARFLPRLEKNVVSTWLSNHVPPGSLIIDPFGASPQMTVEAAQAGYRIITASNNPVTRFLLEFSGNTPESELFQSAISRIAAARVGQERLEPHILSGYITTCDRCSEEIYADSFLWQDEDEGPYARIYSCPHCEHSGEYPATQEDIDRALKFSNNSLHRARALERITSINSLERKYAEAALDAYLPRALYGLSTLSNKIDGLSISPEHEKPLQALLLSTFEYANSLWQYPSGRARPRQLSTPPRYRENNIWFALESSVSEWENLAADVQILQWPNLPPEEGGISIYDGRMKDLSDELAEMKLVTTDAISAAITTFPRPNQAYWTLSALWTGWLWGQEALGKFGSVLRRRRYDWAWHTNALQSSLNNLRKTLPEKTPFFGMVTENEAGFDAAVMIASELAGFELQHSAIRLESGQSQFLWTHKIEPKITKKEIEIGYLIKNAATKLLENFGQPVDYLRIQAAALEALIRENQINGLELAGDEAYTNIRSQLEQAITRGGKFTRFGGGESSIESGKWWLSEYIETEDSLDDRLEKELVNFIIKQPGKCIYEIEQAMCNQFLGELTPERELIISVLISYGEESDDGWKIRASDAPQARKDDISEIKAKLAALGEHLDYKVEDGPAVIWKENDKNVISFHLIASAIISDIAQNANEASANFVVLPGGRAELVLYKLSSNPQLELQANAKLNFIKFRHIRRLAENPTLTRDSFRELLSLDELQKSDPQIPLL